MKKIISLFQRNYETDKLVRDEVVSGAEWVLNGEGIATRKFDGTCCMIQNGKFYKRYELKMNKKIPENFIAAQDPDPVTGDIPGWLPVTCKPEDRYHKEAFDNLNYAVELTGAPYNKDGTYELCGPKIQKNPEGFLAHVLIPHGNTILSDCPRTFYELKSYLHDKSIEGVVWHHPDGRMVKIKTRDFGLRRPVVAHLGEAT